MLTSQTESFDIGRLKEYREKAGLSQAELGKRRRHARERELRDE